MDYLLRQDAEEEKKLINSIGNLNIRQTRRLWILAKKFEEITQAQLYFDWSKPLGKSQENNEHHGRRRLLRTALQNAKHIPKNTAAFSAGHWGSPMINMASVELLDDICQIRLSLDHVMARDQKYFLIMFQRSLQHQIQGKALLYSIEILAAQRDAISADLGLKEIDRPPIPRILAIVELLKYTLLPDRHAGEDRDCGICYEELDKDIPTGAKIKVTRESRGGHTDTTYLIEGTPVRSTHCTAKLPCGHFFGAKCIWRVFLTDTKCPFCRHEYEPQLTRYDRLQ